VPRRNALTPTERTEIASLSSRQASRKYGVSYSTWKRIREDPEWSPRGARSLDADQAVVDRVLESVRQVPQINTVERAKRLGLRCETTQKILVRHRLSNLNARLSAAGYQVEVLRPLALARQRRILATAPGSLTHIDYKTFGFLRGHDAETGKRVGGYVCVDSLTAYASVHLTERQGASGACEALEKYSTNAPFPMMGIIFSDNGPQDFLSDQFIAWVHSRGLVQRTTRYNSPWSNGKVEALNKTLKYQCFPALAAAGVEHWNEVRNLVDLWMEHYNKQRAHFGHVNKGLPPLVWYDLWKRTPGDHVDKLQALGCLPLDNSWHVAMMGGAQGNGGDRPWGPNAQNGNGSAPTGSLPFAFVLTRTGSYEPPSGDQIPNTLRAVQKTQLTLAK
jgi:transposase InsO family protein